MDKISAILSSWSVYFLPTWLLWKGSIYFSQTLPSSFCSDEKPTQTNTIVEHTSCWCSNIDIIDWFKSIYVPLFYVACWCHLFVVLNRKKIVHLTGSLAKRNSWKVKCLNWKAWCWAAAAHNKRCLRLLTGMWSFTWTIVYTFSLLITGEVPSVVLSICPVILVKFIEQFQWSLRSSSSTELVVHSLWRILVILM